MTATAPKLTRRSVVGGLVAATKVSAAIGRSNMLSARIFGSPRHTTHYLEAGPSTGPLMIFVHGWPEIGLMWRAQVEAFAAEGWRCIAPDMRGYGESSAPEAAEAYATREIVQDMVELHDHLGASPAVWVGHDWGSPIAAALAAHHPGRSRGLVLASIPYFPEAFALATLVSLVDRRLYPADVYPDGQWDYYRFYQTHFEQTVSDFDADIAATLSSIFRRGSPEAAGMVSPTASVTKRGGRYGIAHRAPPAPPDPALWTPADFDTLLGAFRAKGFRSANAYYLNDAANIAYSCAAPNGGRLRQPTLFINGSWDPICDIGRSGLGAPMRDACLDLSVMDLPGGHWLPLELKVETSSSIRSWLHNRDLS